VTPHGRVVLLVLGLACSIASEPSTIAQSATGPQSAPSEAYSETIAGSLVAFDMVPVPAGSVTIDGKSVAVPAFYIARREATWDMYDVFALGLDAPKPSSGVDATARPSRPYGAPDYGWGHAGFPVISVTRGAAEAFCTWLSGKTGKRYRLPTEAEWLRVSSLAAGGAELPAERRDTISWHRGNAEGRTHPAGSKAADAFGLFDLFGNAAEWVTTADGMRVLRGGSFRDAVDAIGPAARSVQDDSWNERDPQLPGSRWWLSDAPFAGFRIVREM
jgi:formylglycine-generating enzyme required for sulfatase activity